jgi:penicillin-binding protein 1B
MKSSQGDKMCARRVATVVIITSIVFGFYLWTLYGQLKTAFNRQDQFVPTRIYSDVTRIAPPQSRSSIEERLKSLIYSYQANGNEISFKLHPVDYPVYLIPETHPILNAGDLQSLTITLHFTGSRPESLLQSIDLGSQEVPDLYLEPEIVATLSKSGEAAKKQIRALLNFSDIPAHIWKAVIAIEDQHFLEHSGLDPRGIARAIWVNLKTRSFAQGGSTITQQLVKNLMARRGKNLFSKVNEVFLSILLELTFEKEKILERYLNEVYLGQIGNMEVHGVAEGARHFFGKDVTELNLAETALMAGLIRGPGFYSPYRYKDRAMERQRLVLKKMVETGQIAQGEADQALQLPVHLAPPQTTTNKAPYFTDFVKAELIRQLKGKIAEQELSEAGLRVYTTLDLALNTAAQHAVSEGLADIEAKMKAGKDSRKERLEGALASVDHSNGFIRVLIGGRNYAESNFNRILNMKRQVGSTFKPLVYLSAIQRGRDAHGVPYGPGHPVEDSPWTLIYDRGKQKWAPKNYEKEYKGWTSFRSALAHSINTAAAKIGWEVGIDSIIKTARALGIESDLPDVPSLSLGVAELSPIELLKTYATFANHGMQDDLTVIRAITQDNGNAYARFVYHPRQVFEAGAVDLLTEMLQSVFSEGTAKDAIKMGFDRPAAGKTGTTSNYRDAWFAGYTPQLTTVVWVGADLSNNKVSEQKKGLRLTGATSALPIWISFMKTALDGEPPLTFRFSPDILDVTIDQKTGLRAAPQCPISQVITEKYLKGLEPDGSSCEALWPPSIPQVNAN